MNRAIAFLADQGLVETSARLGTFAGPQVGGLAPAGTVTTQRAVIGLLVQDGGDAPDHFWGPTVRRALEAGCSTRGFVSRVAWLGPGSGAMADALAELGEVDALAVMQLSTNPEVLATLMTGLKPAIPFVIVGTSERDLPLPHTCVDERGAGFTAATALAQAGYRSVAPIAPFRSPWWEARCSGLALAARQHGLARLSSGAPRIAYERWFERSAAVKADDVGALVDAALASPGPAPALLCANDEVALLAMAHLHAAGHQPGAEVGVIGFDDNPPASGAGLSSMRQPLAEMAEDAARLLSDALSGRATAIQLRHLPRAIRRGSTDRSARR